jgi:hypothetical protein
LVEEEELEEPAGVDAADGAPAEESAGVDGTLWAINNDPLRIKPTNENCLFMNRPAELGRLIIGCGIATLRISLFYPCRSFHRRESEDIPQIRKYRGLGETGARKTRDSAQKTRKARVYGAKQQMSS